MEEFDFDNYHGESRSGSLFRSVIKYSVIGFGIFYAANVYNDSKIENGDISARQVGLFKESLISNDKYRSELLGFLDDIVQKYPQESTYLLSKYNEKNKSIEPDSIDLRHKTDISNVVGEAKMDYGGILKRTLGDISEIAKKLYKGGKEKAREADQYLSE